MFLKVFLHSRGYQVKVNSTVKAFQIYGIIYDVWNVCAKNALF